MGLGEPTQIELTRRLHQRPNHEAGQATTVLPTVPPQPGPHKALPRRSKGRSHPRESQSCHGCCHLACVPPHGTGTSPAGHSRSRTAAKTPPGLPFRPQARLSVKPSTTAQRTTEYTRTVLPDPTLGSAPAARYTGQKEQRGLPASSCILPEDGQKLSQESSTQRLRGSPETRDNFQGKGHDVQQPRWPSVAE